MRCPPKRFRKYSGIVNTYASDVLMMITNFAQFIKRSKYDRLEEGTNIILLQFLPSEFVYVNENVYRAIS